jgi:hypothetical protein
MYHSILQKVRKSPEKEKKQDNVGVTAGVGYSSVGIAIAM